MYQHAFAISRSTLYEKSALWTPIEAPDELRRGRCIMVYHGINHTKSTMATIDESTPCKVVHWPMTLPASARGSGQGLSERGMMGNKPIMELELRNSAIVSVAVQPPAQIRDGWYVPVSPMRPGLYPVPSLPPKRNSPTS